MWCVCVQRVEGGILCLCSSERERKTETREEKRNVEGEKKREENGGRPDLMDAQIQRRRKV